jgi:cyclohexanecarboxylate-CoA ligase
MPEAARAEEYRRRGWWREETFVSDLRRWAAETPDRMALHSHFREPEAHGGPDLELTWAELAARVDRCAGGLLELGVGRGDVVVVQLINTWQAAVTILATARIGAVVAPVLAVAEREELEPILRQTRARVFVVMEAFRGLPLAETAAALRREVPTLEHVVVLGDAARTGALDFGRQLAGTPWEERHPPAVLDRLAPGPDDPWQLLFTSGTTGGAKGVLHSCNTLYAVARASCEPIGLGRDDVATSPMAVTHQAGFTHGLVMPLILGAGMVFADTFDPDDLLDLMERTGVSFVYVTPDLTRELVDGQRARPRRLRLHTWATGSAPVASDLPARFREVMGVRLHALWGMTENGAVTVTRPDDPDDWAARSDGRPVPWMEVRLAADDGGEVADGEIGRLQVRGASQCLGYWGDEAGYAAQFDAGGWFESGDLARSDGRGGIKIVGRLSDAILRGGRWVPVGQVEDDLAGHGGVREVALVGEPSPELGERICAFVVAADPADPPALERLRDHLAAVGTPADWWPERLELVDELPRNPTGKVLKRVLRERLTGARPAGR